MTKAQNTLEHAIQYLEEKNYLADYAMEKGITYAQWSRDIGQSRRTLEELSHSLTHIVEYNDNGEDESIYGGPFVEDFDPKPIGFDETPEVNGDYAAPIHFDIEAGPYVLIAVEMNMKALEVQVLKDVLKDSDIVSTLPFTAAVRAGEHFFHITNESAYPIETGVHTVTQGMALCGRYNGEPLGPRMWGAGDPYTFAVPTCPGCIAKGKNLSAKSVWHYLHRRDEK